MDETGRIADDDAQSLADRLAEFDASLPPRQQALFRSRILLTLGQGQDVVGHRMEQRWDSGPDGLYRTWVYIDDNLDTLDPQRWNTLTARGDASAPAAAVDQRAEGPA